MEGLGGFNKPYRSEPEAASSYGKAPAHEQVARASLPRPEMSKSIVQPGHCWRALKRILTGCINKEFQDEVLRPVVMHIICGRPIWAENQANVYVFALLPQARVELNTFWLPHNENLPPA